MLLFDSNNQNKGDIIGSFASYLRDVGESIIKNYYNKETTYSVNVKQMSYIREHRARDNLPLRKFPWHVLNSALSLGGIPRGIIVLGAPSGVGKTFLSTQISCSLVLDSLARERECMDSIFSFKGKDDVHEKILVGVMSFEATEDHILSIISSLFRDSDEKTLDDLLHRVYFSDLENARCIRDLFKCVVDLIDIGCNVIIIDYIQLVCVEQRGHKHEQIGEFMRFIEKLYKINRNICFIVTSQVKKSSNGDSVFDCSLSSIIKQKADLLLFVTKYQESSKKSSCVHSTGSQFGKVLSIHIDKYRHGFLTTDEELLIIQPIGSAKYICLDEYE